MDEIREALHDQGEPFLYRGIFVRVRDKVLVEFEAFPDYAEQVVDDFVSRDSINGSLISPWIKNTFCESCSSFPRYVLLIKYESCT